MWIVGIKTLFHAISFNLMFSQPVIIENQKQKVKHVLFIGGTKSATATKDVLNSSFPSAI